MRVAGKEGEGVSSKRGDGGATIGRERKQPGGGLPGRLPQYILTYFGQCLHRID